MNYYLALTVSILAAFIVTLWGLGKVDERYRLSKKVWMLAATVVFGFLQWLIQSVLTGDF